VGGIGGVGGRGGAGTRMVGVARCVWLVGRLGRG
jgi:hypothetical protein